MRVILSVAGAGGLALAAQLSIRTPWTPVPFSFQPLAVLLVGTLMGPAWSLLSVAVYLAAAAFGLPVLAGGAGGLGELTGSTAGYLFGFAAAASLTGWLVRRPAGDGRSLPYLAAGVGVLGAAALAAFTWIALQGETFTADYSRTRSLLWVFASLAAAAAMATALWAWRLRGLRGGFLRGWLACMAGIAVLHACGVLVLKPMMGYSWPEAVALGSAVFLPFDLVKAAVAATVAIPFLPTPGVADAPEGREAGR
ncbi:MAG TPA: biotin transporter BioY [Candidatus Thermoplasmatota archaeon]|nr:biotin transporter BioY [Candidatus Thermoplasmatota archaeon]